MYATFYRSVFTRTYIYNEIICASNPPILRIKFSAVYPEESNFCEMYNYIFWKRGNTKKVK